MTLIRLAAVAIFGMAATGCSVLHLSGNSAGVRVVGKQTYCGTPSQASAVHYFATKAEFENWATYRDIDGWSENVPPRGLVVVEMGQRPTGGYALKLDNDDTFIKNNRLQIAMNWDAPRLDSAVSQAMTTQCVAIALPNGEYQTVEIVDQIGNSRGQLSVNRSSAGT